MAARKGNSSALKYSDEKAAAIVEALKAGATRSAAAGRVGVRRETFWRWMKNATFCNAVVQAEDDCETQYAAVLKKAAHGYDSGHTTTTTKTVFKTKKQKLPDGTIIEEPVAMQEVVSTHFVEKSFDWRAAESWLKRRRKDDWGDHIKEDVSTSGTVELVVKRLGEDISMDDL